MIKLKTGDGTLKIDGIEDLLKLSNEQRMELFGKYYSNKMIRNYGKLDEMTLIDGLILMLSDTLRHRSNIKAILAELKENWYFRELIEGATISIYDSIPSTRRLQSQKSAIERREYRHSHGWGKERFVSYDDSELSVELCSLFNLPNDEDIVEELNKKYLAQKNKEESNG